MNKLSVLTFKYLKFKLHRTLTTIIGITLSSMLIYVIFACGYSGYDSMAYDDYVESMGWDAVYVCEDSSVAKDIIKLAPYYNQEHIVDDSGFAVSHAFIVGVDRYTYSNAINDFDAMPVSLALVYGSVPKTENAIIVPQSVSRSEKLNVGDLYYYSYRLDENKSEVCDGVKLINGIYRDSFGNDETGIGEINSDVIMLDSYSNYVLLTDDMMKDNENLSVYVTFESKKDIKAQAAKLSAAFGNIDYVVSETAINCFAAHENNNSFMYLAFQAVLLIFAAIGAIAALFMVRNAFNISVHERSNDYGILRCIGMSRRQIVRLILYESLMMSAVGITLGMLLGHIISMGGFAFIRYLLGLSAGFKVRLYDKAVLMTVIYVLITAGYAMISPIQKLYKLNPIDALRKTDEITIGKAFGDKKKKTKHAKGKRITKLFGIEFGYAYKNVMRNKGRFLISVVMLAMGTMLFVGISSAFYMGEKWIKSEISHGDYDGEFNVRDYKEGCDILADLKSMRAADDTKLYLYQYAINKSGDGNVEGSDEYIGLETKLFEKWFENVENENYDRDENVINVISVGLMNEYSIGDVVKIYSGNDEFKLHICGIMPMNEYHSLLSDIGLYITVGNSDRIFIYELGGDLDVLESSTEGYDIVANDYLLKIKLAANKSTKSFDTYISDSNHYYNDYSEYAKQMVNTIKAVKYIATMFIVILMLIFITNVINTNRAQLLLRKNELYIMRVIGMSYKQESRILYSESLIMTVTAWIIGVLAGVGAGYAMVTLMLIDESVKLSVDWVSLLVSAVFIMSFSILSVFLSREDE